MPLLVGVETAGRHNGRYNGSHTLAERACHRRLNRCACWANRRVMHQANTSRRPLIWHRFRTGGCNRRCGLWMCCGIGFDFHLKHLGRPTSMDSHYRWLIPLLSGPQNILCRAYKGSCSIQGRRFGLCLRLDAFPDAHKSNDATLFHGNNRRLRSGNYNRRRGICSISDPRRIRWLSHVVAHLERKCWCTSGEAQFSQAAVGKQNFRCHYHRIRFGRSPEFSVRGNQISRLTQSTSTKPETRRILNYKLAHK